MKISIYNVQDHPIGGGGMGEVYRGWDERGNAVAIKKIRAELTADSDVRAMFHKEVNTLTQFDHRSIVKMYGSFEERGNLYLVMEYVDGETIEQHVQRCGAFSESKAIQLFVEILSAVGYVHQAEKVHRDIKPSNIIVKPDGRICLIDFGIVKDMKHSTGQTITQIIGTDGYMSPEQAAPATIDYRSDIYSLGCLLYYMLVGNHAIQKQSNDHATKMTILKSAFPKAQHFNPNLSNHIQQILDKATDKNMLRRFQSCREFELKIGSGATVVGVENFRPLQYQIDHTISVGRQNCDIIVYDPTEKVSRHHLDIIKMQCPPEEVDTIHFLIRDRSTNGTTISFHFGNYVNSEKIHSTETMIDVNADEYTPNYPKILLAGKVELNWSDVEAAFARKRNATKSSVINTPPPAPSIDEAKKARRKSAIPEIIGGIVLIAVGVILTVISLSSDSRIGYVFYGLVAAGAVSVIKGIRSMKPANSTAGSMYQQAREGQSAAGWLVAIYILAFCGLLGFLGLFFGIMVYCSKITLPDGQKTPKYKKSHRTAALIGAILSAVLMIAIIIILSYI